MYLYPLGLYLTIHAYRVDTVHMFLVSSMSIYTFAVRQTTKYVNTPLRTTLCTDTPSLASTTLFVYISQRLVVHHNLRLVSSQKGQFSELTKYRHAGDDISFASWQQLVAADWQR